jgi:hypothetical protein
LFVRTCVQRRRGPRPAREIQFELPGYPETLTDLVENPGETINYAQNASYAKIKKTLRKVLLENLAARGLTPLPQDRTIEHIRAKENKQTNKKNKAKD